jgi:prepilin peptidase CpaA
VRQLWTCGSPWTVPEIAFLVALLGLVGYAALSDIRRFRIPNAVSIALVCLFVVRYALTGQPTSIIPHLAIAGASLAILFALYLLGWFGAGDAKLISAIMLWAGPEAGMQFILLLALAGGFFATLLLLVAGALRIRTRLAANWPPHRLFRWAERGVCPYGIPIFAAVLVVSPLFFNGAVCKSQPLPALSFQFESKARLFLI